MNPISPDDRLLLRKAEDAVILGEKRNMPVFLGFLNEHESEVIRDNMKYECISFYGGRHDSVRVIMGVNASENDYPVTLLKFVYRKEDNLSHRDFLGALMGLGLNRDVVGDIIVEPGLAYVYVKSENADYIIAQTDKIGRCGVRISKEEDTEIEYVQNFDTDVYTLSSLRLDVFISALCGLSRDKANKIIKAEFVAVNHYVITDNSRTLETGDVITVRKYGKYVFEKTLGFSKKGKYRVEIKKFK